MIHHQSDIGLGEQTDILAFRNTAADEFMVPLAAALLVRRAGIAVKHPGSAVAISSEFNGFRIAEFAAVVGQKKRENMLKVIGAKAFIE